MFGSLNTSVLVSSNAWAPKTYMPINKPTLSVAFIMVAIGVVAFVSLLFRLSETEGAKSGPP